jgi:hypothetical protein
MSEEAKLAALIPINKVSQLLIYYQKQQFLVICFYILHRRHTSKNALHYTPRKLIVYFYFHFIAAVVDAALD